MSILNFTEIPSSSPKVNKNKNTLDSFEKFAEEFFEVILNSEILTPMSKGADDGKDLVVTYMHNKCLVSCKHYAYSGEAIGTAIEQDILDRVILNGCDKFIGFYSTHPSSSLITKLEGLKSQHGLEYEIFKSSDIESKLLDTNNAKGWLLAARYFPNSYSNLFQRFVVPITYYKESDFKNNSLKGPFGGIHHNRSALEVISEANDNITNEIHKIFFNNAIKDAINLFPRYFAFDAEKDVSKLSLGDITPAWDTELDREYAKCTIECNIPIIISIIWSLWDMDKSMKKYLKYKEVEIDFKKKFISSSEMYTIYSSIKFLTLGNAGIFSNGCLRDLFARLIAFTPLAIDSYKGDNLKSFEDPEKEGKVIQWKLNNSNVYDFLDSLNSKKSN